MSAEATSWAYKVTTVVVDADGGAVEKLKMGPKFLLVALANYADEEHSAFPSFNTLAERMSCSRTAVITSIEKLEDLGLVIIEKRLRGNGSHSSNRYHLPVDNWAPLVAGGSTDSAPPPTDAPVDNSPGGSTESEPGEYGIRTPLNSHPNQGNQSQSVPNATTDAQREPKAGSAGDGQGSPSPTPKNLAGFRGHGISTPDIFASVGEYLAPTHIDAEGLELLATRILAKASTRVVNPTAYVVKALRNPATRPEWVAEAWDCAAVVHLRRVERKAAS